MALVPTRPFTFFQLLRSQYLLLLVLGLLTGTMIVPLLSSMSLAHFNNRLSRAESLFTTFAFHTHNHTTTSHYGFHFAAASTNAFMITMTTSVLGQSPTSVYPPLGSSRVPGCPGGRQMAGGSRESHLTIKQTEGNRVSVLRLLLTHFHSFHTLTSTHNSTDWPGSIRWWYCGWWFCRLFGYWQNAHICLYQFHPESGRLFRKNSLFPRSARAASIQENGRKRANNTGWAPRIQLYPSFVPSAFTDWVIFMPFTSWISIFGNELRLSLPCLDWMSTWLALLACLLWNQPSL